MKIDKIAQKRALAEYRGKRDYERLLKSYGHLEQEINRVKMANRLVNHQLEAESELCGKLIVTVIVLGNLLLFALIGCAYLWGRGV